MKRTKLAASFLLVATLFLTGCVTKKEFVNLQTDYNKLKDEKSALDKSYQDAQIQLAEYRTQSKSLEDRLSEARKNNQELRNSYATLQGSLDKSLRSEPAAPPPQDRFPLQSTDTSQYSVSHGF